MSVTCVLSVVDPKVAAATGKGVPPYALYPQSAERLWELSERWLA
jgi:hypothetical protein